MPGSDRFYGGGVIVRATQKFLFLLLAFCLWLAPSPRINAQQPKATGLLTMNSRLRNGAFPRSEAPTPASPEMGGLRAATDFRYPSRYQTARIAMPSTEI